MAITQIASYGISGASAAYLTPVERTYQTKKTTARSGPTAYRLELSHSAQAKSLKLSGYPVSVISLKLGLDVATVQEYLGIADPVKPRYIAPKPAYTEPVKQAEDRGQLTQDLYQLSFARSEWSSLISTVNVDVLTSDKALTNARPQKGNNILTIG